jgi:hypothetical protein
MIVLDAEMWGSEAHADGLIGPQTGGWARRVPAKVRFPSTLVDVTSPYHSLTLKKANKKRTLVITPVINNRTGSSMRYLD